MSRTVALTCDIDIEQSWESFHAHAIPDGIEIMPGDVILVHDIRQMRHGSHNFTKSEGGERPQHHRG